MIVTDPFVEFSRLETAGRLIVTPPLTVTFVNTQSPATVSPPLTFEPSGTGATQILFAGPAVVVPPTNKTATAIVAAAVVRPRMVPPSRRSAAPASFSAAIVRAVRRGDQTASALFGLR
jgi:hypothetical protein